MVNEYFKDACLFLNSTARVIDEEISAEDVLKASLFFALGMERILKAILYDANPVYVFNSQDFKNTVALLYRHKLLPSASQNPEISSKPDSSVLTFKQSLMRAKALSLTTDKHCNLLFYLSNIRDIIAHRPLSNLDINEVDRLRTLLKRDFYHLMKEYSQEFEVPLQRLVGSDEGKLARISGKFQMFEDQIKAKIETQKTLWKELQHQDDLVAKARSETEKLLCTHEEALEIVPCPSCENDALLIVEHEYGPDMDGEAVRYGTFVLGFRCMYCDLILSNYDEIDYLKLIPKMHEYKKWKGEVRSVSVEDLLSLRK